MSERCHEIHVRTTKKYRIVCPECTASFLVDRPEAMVWELCPACKRHVWDAYDVLLADRICQARSTGGETAPRGN